MPRESSPKSIPLGQLLDQIPEIVRPREDKADDRHRGGFSSRQSKETGERAELRSRPEDRADSPAFIGLVYVS
jgi:hypothetical protein